MRVDNPSTNHGSGHNGEQKDAGAGRPRIGLEVGFRKQKLAGIPMVLPDIPAGHGDFMLKVAPAVESKAAKIETIRASKPLLDEGRQLHGIVKAILDDGEVWRLLTDAPSRSRIPWDDLRRMQAVVDVRWEVLLHNVSTEPPPYQLIEELQTSLKQCLADDSVGNPADVREKRSGAGRCRCEQPGEPGDGRDQFG
jgi:hypothetical protein